MKEVGNAPHVRFPPTFIYIFIRINCSFENEKFKQNKGKRKTHNVSNAYSRCTAEAQDNINIEIR